MAERRARGRHADEEDEVWFRHPWEDEPADDPPGLRATAARSRAIGRTGCRGVGCRRAPPAARRRPARRWPGSTPRLADATPDVADGPAGAPRAARGGRLAGAPARRLGAPDRSRPARGRADRLAHRRGHERPPARRPAGHPGPRPAAAADARRRRAPEPRRAGHGRGRPVAEDRAVARGAAARPAVAAAGRAALPGRRSPTPTPCANSSPSSAAPRRRRTRWRIGSAASLAGSQWPASGPGALPTGRGAALPALLRAGQAAQAWAACEAPGQGRGDRLSTAALFLAAAVWRIRAVAARTVRWSGPARRDCRSWSATPRHLERLALAAGPDWLGGFLAAVTDAAQRAGQELSRLQIAAARAAALRRTAPLAPARRRRTRPAPARADRRAASPSGCGSARRTALGLLDQLVAAGVLREATGRAAWRAFVV